MTVGCGGLIFRGSDGFFGWCWGDWMGSLDVDLDVDVDVDGGGGEVGQ